MINEFNNSVMGDVDRKQYNHLLWLEHRRWIGFMLVNNFDRPEDEEVRFYIFRDGNDHKDKINKKHICLKWSNYLGEGEEIHFISDQPDIFNQDLSTLVNLDPLDYMSVWFHQLCKGLILQRKATIQRLLDTIEDEINFQNKTGVIELYKNLKDYTKRLVNDLDPSAMKLWKNALALLKVQDLIEIKRFKTLLELLEKEMKIVFEVILKKDYKKIDDTILRVIPLMLLEGKNGSERIQTIHKIASNSDWENLITTLLIEPESLNIYIDNKHDQQSYRDVLKVRYETILKQRGISTKITILNQSAIDQNHFENNDLIDITGCNSTIGFQIGAMNVNRDCLVVSLKDNQMTDSTRGQNDFHYKMNAYNLIPASIQVEELLAIHQLALSSHSKRNNALMLTPNYLDLWDFYCKINKEQYEKLCGIIQEVEKGKYFQIPANNDTSEILTYDNLPYEALDKMGLIDLFHVLESKNRIKINSLPIKNDIPGTVEIVVYNQKLAGYFKKKLKNLILKSYNYQYQLIEKSDGELEIYEQSLHTIIQDPNLKDAFDPLWNYPTIATKLENDEALEFYFKNEATKQCFMVFNQVIQTFIFHTISRFVSVDDLKVDVQFDEKQVVDLVFTKGMQTFFIQCLSRVPEMQDFYVLGDLIQTYGINGKGIIISFANESATRTGNYNNIASHFKEDLYYIDLYLLLNRQENKIGNDVATTATTPINYLKNYDVNQLQDHLIQLLKNIIEGKKDWESLNKTCTNV